MNVGRQASKEGNESHRPLKEREHVTMIDEASVQDIVNVAQLPRWKCIVTFHGSGAQIS
jgi:hypothetical protein